MPTYAVCKALTASTKLSEGEQGYVLRYRFDIRGISTDADYVAAVAANPSLDQLSFAMQLPDRLSIRDLIPKRGDKRVFYSGINGTTATLIPVFCLNKTGTFNEGSPASTNVALIDVEFGEVGVPVDVTAVLNGSNSVYSWLGGASVNGTTVNVRTNFAWNISGTNETFGQLSQVYYNPTASTFDYTSDANLTADVASGNIYSQYVTLPSLEGITNFQLNMREIIHPGASNVNLRSLEAKIAYYNGAMNSQPIWGFPAFSLRLRAAVGGFDVLRNLPILNPDSGSALPAGTRSILRDVGYFFEHRPRGWKEIVTLKEPWTGFEFPNIENPATGIAAGATHGNGWGQFSPLRPRDFSELGLPDVRLL